MDRNRGCGRPRRDVSLHIEEAKNRGLVKAFDVTTMGSTNNEWKVFDITASGLQFLEDTKRSRKIRLGIWSAITVLLGFLAWLIPVVISLFKK